MKNLSKLFCLFFFILTFFFILREKPQNPSYIIAPGMSLTQQYEKGLSDFLQTILGKPHFILFIQMNENNKETVEERVVMDPNETISRSNKSKTVSLKNEFSEAGKIESEYLDSDSDLPGFPKIKLRYAKKTKDSVENTPEVIDQRGYRSRKTKASSHSKVPEILICNILVDQNRIQDLGMSKEELHKNIESFLCMKKNKFIYINLMIRPFSSSDPRFSIGLKKILTVLLILLGLLVLVFAVFKFKKSKPVILLFFSILGASKIHAQSLSFLPSSTQLPFGHIELGSVINIGTISDKPHYDPLWFMAMGLSPRISCVSLLHQGQIGFSFSTLALKKENDKASYQLAFSVSSIGTSAGFLNTKQVYFCNAPS